ncbi:MAG: glycosyltransferase family 2 protein [Spirochaetes bacterium]|nr:glycosyltransferase family 2 protein [Spirochaetota bacterium]
MELPLVSVIIPTYNRKQFVLEALKSVFEQTYNSMEVIVVDDGSTDGTEAVLKAVYNHHRLRYFHIPHCGFPGAVRNYGIKEAEGEYIAFLDSDDLWMKEKIDKQIAYMLDNPDIKICHTREIWLRGTTVVSQSGQKHRRGGYIFEDALKKCIIGPSTVLIKKPVFEAHGGFNESLEIAEDYELWLRLTSLYTIGYLDIPLVIKRGGHSGQLSEKYGRIEYFRIEALRKALESGAFSAGQREQAFKELSRKCSIYAGGCLKRGKTEEGEKYRNLSRLFSEKVIK